MNTSSRNKNCAASVLQAYDRRSFLGTTAAAVTASTLPGWYVEELRAAQTATDAGAQKTKDLAIALIGCGGRGRGVARSAANFGRVVALCDVDDQQLDAAQKTWPDAATAEDFRRVVERGDIDIVVCGTVDHWHALVSIAAMRAGKDV